MANELIAISGTNLIVFTKIALNKAGTSLIRVYAPETKIANILKAIINDNEKNDSSIMISS